MMFLHKLWYRPSNRTRDMHKPKVERNLFCFYIRLVQPEGYNTLNYSLKHLELYCYWKKRKTLPKGTCEVISLGLFEIGFVLSLGLFLNGSEQNRMRFTVEPLMIFVVAYFIASILKHIRDRKLI